MLNLIIALLCFSGFFIGRFIASITKEEVKAAKKYFILISKIIPVLMFLLIVVFRLDIVLLMLAAIVISLILRNYYLFLGASFLAYSDVNFILLNSLLVFLFCLFDGSLSKNYKGVVVKFILFILPVLGGVLNALFNWNWTG